jgi:hypothetical protein
VHRAWRRALPLVHTAWITAFGFWVLNRGADGSDVIDVIVVGGGADPSTRPVAKG